MTTPNFKFLDPNNQLLAAGPAALETGTIAPPGKPALGVLTFRTSSTTLTTLMGVEDLRQWAGIINDLADSIDGGAKLALATPMDLQVIANAASPFSKR